MRRESKNRQKIMNKKDKGCKANTKMKSEL